MTWSKAAKGASIIALLASAPMGARAMDITDALNGASRVSGDMIVKVYVHRGPAGGVHGRPGAPGYRPGYHPGVHPGYRPGVGYRPGAPGYRPGYHPPVVVGGWNRPGWYRWGPGGAIAAGAAIGFVGAATAAAWAGAPPQAGLCWYYTDPSQRSGFWDACP